MPTLEFKGKQFVYSHRLGVPFRELEVVPTSPCPPSPRNKRSALRRIVFERRGHGEGSDRDPAGCGFAQPALRELA